MIGRLREAMTRLRGFVLRRSLDDRLDEELRFHRDMLEDRFRAQGFGEDAARRRAATAIGGPSQVRDAYLDQRSIPVLESALQDVRYALRTFRRAPAFTGAALLTLAVGIGATAAVFSVANAVLLRPLPYAQPDQLVVFSEGPRTFGNIGYGTFADLRERSRGFSQMAAIRTWQPTLVTTEAERLTGMRVSWSYFELLGAKPALGRLFTAADDHPDRYRVVVLSDALWRRRFGADPSVVGRTIVMNDLSYQIVGVMPAGFEDLVSSSAYQRAEVWAALGYDASLSYACRGCRHLKAIGRLQPGVTPQEAAAELTAIRSDLMQQYPSAYPPAAMNVTTLDDAVSGELRPALLVLLGAVAFVLLIACANVANLMLARALGRTREIAVRSALGAGRARLLQQMVTESVLLWSVGGVAGVGIATLLVQLLTTIAPTDLPRAGAIAIDREVLAFAAVLSIGTGVLFGLLPAFAATSGRLGRTLAGSFRGSIAAPAPRLRTALVVLNLSAALVLLAGAGLMLKSVARVLAIDPGFRSEGVLTAQLSLVGERYRQDTAVQAFIGRFAERIRSLPGVQAAALAGQVPMGGNGDRFVIHIQGSETANPAEAPAPERYSVTREYFSVMRIPLLRGRLLDARDTAASAPVMLVSETAARTLFNGGDALGHMARVGGAPDAPWRTIVGVVGDVRHADLVENVWPQMYLPQSQFTDSFLVLAVRTDVDNPATLVPSIRAALREEDPSVPLYDVATLDSLVRKSLAPRRFVMLLLSGFALVSLLLASIGLYGVIAYLVAGRTREVGVRVALGATRRHIFTLVIGTGLRTLVAGLAGGLAAAMLLTRLLEGQLYGVEPLDPAAILSAVVVLALVAAAAHVGPIRRALRVDPTVALRDE